MTEEAIYEGQDTITESMLLRVNKLLERAEAYANMDERDLEANYGPAGSEGRLQLEREREALVQRAAEIIAKYGIDRAMLAASGKLTDGTIDKVVMAARPFAAQQNQLFAVVAQAMGMRTSWIKSWNPMSGPKARGGVPRGGYDYGYRVFAFESDWMRGQILFTSLLGQMLNGVSNVRDTGTKFGQRQKAMRESWLDGFVAGVQSQILQAERVAREQAEAAEQEARDRAMMDGTVPMTSEPSVAIVLADRKTALARAYDAAQGITPEQRAKWAADQEARVSEYRAEQERKRQEKADCKKCQKAKSGSCNEHRIKVGRSYRYSQERVGDAMGMWSRGHAAGRAADLGAKTSVGAGSQKAI